MPVFECGRVVGTLTLVFFSSAMPLADAVNRYVQALKDAAHALSEELTHGTRPADDGLGEIQLRESAARPMTSVPPLGVAH